MEMQSSSMFSFIIALLCLLEAILQGVLYLRFFLMSLEGFWWCDAIPEVEEGVCHRNSCLQGERDKVIHTKFLNGSPHEAHQCILDLKHHYWLQTFFRFSSAIIIAHRKHIFHECSFKTHSYMFFPLEKNEILGQFCFRSYF